MTSISVLVVASVPRKVSVTPPAIRRVPKLDEDAPLIVTACPTLLALLPTIVSTSTVITAPLAMTAVSPSPGTLPPTHEEADDQFPVTAFDVTAP